jgi:hypothetical protein
MASVSVPVAFLALCFALCAQRAAAAEEGAPAADAQPVEAIWKEHEFSFHFQSFTTFYSCTGLESKLERLLKALGAKDANVRVRAPECPSTVARMPRVTVEARTPVEATPQAIAERDKNKSTRELAARVQGKSGEADEITEQFPANWKRVSLSRGSLSLEPGDCELIDELRRKVLPRLAVRVINDKVSCSPHTVTLGQPQLEVEALVALPKPDEKKNDPR